jgi:sRNA-binding regulator protein Hfq
MADTAKLDEKIPGRWGLSEARFLSDCENEPVAIHLRSGEIMRGFIVGVDNYGIGLEVTGRANPVWVHKHAVDYIERE